MAQKKSTKTVAQNIFTPSQLSDLNLILNEIENFFSKELVKLKKTNPFTITQTKDGFDLGFYRIKKVEDLYEVKTLADDKLADFTTISHAVLYCCLIVKKIFRIADDLASLHQEYIQTKNEYIICESNFNNVLKKKTKSNDDWWKHDLYQTKTIEAKMKFNISKSKLVEFTKYNHMLKKLKTTHSLD
jgi:hypothetical protein